MRQIESISTPFLNAYEVASPIIHDWENYVVIHSALQEDSEAIANEVLYNPSEKTFMFVDTGNDIYQEYNDFSLVKKFMTKQEIEKFNEVMLKTKEIEKFATELQQHLHTYYDKDFDESVITISENLANRNIDDYIERLDIYVRDLESSAAELTSYASVGALVDESEAEKAVNKYNEVNDTLNKLRELSKDRENSNQEGLDKTQWAEGLYESAVQEVLEAAEIPEPDFGMEM